MMKNQWSTTWRVIPVSKWLVTPPFISNLGHLEGNNGSQLGGLTITMVLNHLLSRMILQVAGRWKARGGKPTFCPSFGHGSPRSCASLTIYLWNIHGPGVLFFLLSCSSHLHDFLGWCMLYHVMAIFGNYPPLSHTIWFFLVRKSWGQVLGCLPSSRK